MPVPLAENLVERFADSWNAGDAAALADLFAEDADFVNVVGLWWRNRDDIRKAHSYGFERIFSGAWMHILETKVRDLGDVAIVHGRWEMTGQTAPDGSPAGRRRGVLAIVARRTPEGWEAVAAQNTDRIPGSETVLVRGGRAAAVTYRA
jgi:uncharacterized protein (TIGR02246 family)